MPKIKGPVFEENARPDEGGGRKCAGVEGCTFFGRHKVTSEVAWASGEQFLDGKVPIDGTLFSEWYCTELHLCKDFAAAKAQRRAAEAVLALNRGPSGT